jgi:hypothetical protein
VLLDASFALLLEPLELLELLVFAAIDSLLLLLACGVVVAGCSALGVVVVGDWVYGWAFCAIATPITPAVATVDTAVIQNLVAFIFLAPEKWKKK